MTFHLSSRFSDSTIASASSSFSLVSSASSASSVEDLLLPAFDSYPKPPPRTTSITLNSTKTYSSTERRDRKKPAPLQLTTSNKATSSSSSTAAAAQRQVRSTASSSFLCLSEDEETYFSCKENPRKSRSSYRSKCFCGSAVRAASSTSTSVEIYCSRECARQDALYALEGRSPNPSDPSALYSDNEEEDEDFPVTPTNAFVPSPPRTPVAKGRERRICPSLTRKLTGLGASHYRRMEALGLYDADVSPTRSSKTGALMNQSI